MSILHDILYDLREKRLWPVAVALLLALIAVPILLSKPASEEAASSPATPAADGATLPIAGTSEGTASDSRLDAFDPKDPFKPLVDPSKGDGLGRSAADGASGAGSPRGGADEAGAGIGGSTADDGSSGIASAGGESPTEGSAPSGGSGPTGGSDTGGGNPGSGGDEAPAKPTTFTYTVDIRFGERDGVRLRKGVQRLSVLPNDANPLLVFLGVTADAEGAVFLVNSRLNQEGEGDCQPTKKDCTFLELRDRDLFDEHLFTDRETGKGYYLQLLRINRVPVETLARRAAAKADAANESRSASHSPPKPFVLPLFGDTVE